MKFIRKNKTITSISLILYSIFWGSQVMAELKLPSGTDRRPNLSLDPFERAREAVRKLPTSKPVQAIPETTPSQEPEAEPVIIETIDEPIPDSTNQEQPVVLINSGTSGEAFSYEFSSIIDAFSLTAGGLQETDEETPTLKNSGIVGIVNFVSEVDTGAFNLWDNGLFFVNAALIFGESPTSGDIHGISSIDAGESSMRIVELWYQHSFPFSHSSVLFGLHDFNSEFYVSEYANLFVNGGFGMGQSLSEHGHPSTYPFINLGLRFKSALSENSYFQIAMYDGASQPDELNKIISIKLDKNEGVFIGGEIGMIKNVPGASEGYLKIAAGAWYLRSDQLGFTTKNGTAILADNPKPGTSGAYFLAETSIGKKLGLFFKHGRAQSSYNQYPQFYATGLNFTGAIPGRDEDILGIGLVHTRQSSEYLAQLEGDTQSYVAETTYEITYTTQITNWLMVQPDYQYIQYPNMDPNIVKASVIGVRVQAVF